MDNWKIPAVQTDSEGGMIKLHGFLVLWNVNILSQKSSFNKKDHQTLYGLKYFIYVLSVEVNSETVAAFQFHGVKHISRNSRPQEY